MQISGKINSSRKTKSIYNVLIVFLVLLFYLIPWILVGEIDSLNLHWFITPFQSVENGVLVTREIFFNLNILYIFATIWLFSIIFFVLFKFVFNKINWDSLPFLVMSNMMGLALFCTGFIPYTTANAQWIIIARFVIILFVSLISFFITNAFTSKILLNGNDSSLIYEELKNEYMELKRMKQENDAFIGKNTKEKDYIEIEEE